MAEAIVTIKLKPSEHRTLVDELKARSEQLHNEAGRLRKERGASPREAHGMEQRAASIELLLTNL